MRNHDPHEEVSDLRDIEPNPDLSRSELASLLGDPAFPNILSGVSLGQQIVHFQALYEQYSTLGLSKPMDRPTAIDSLQQRLLRTMKLRGGFGVFDGGDNKGLLRRSLLWYRNDPGSVVHIPELKTQVPTWSWMSHSSPIKYFEIEPNKYDWRDLTSPWASNAKDKLSIVGSAQRLDLGAATSGSSSKIIMDVATPLPPNSSGDKAGFEASQVSSSAMCIVLGNFRDDRPSTEQTHYFLIIEKSSSARVDENTYERIGAGFASGRCIHSDKIEVVIR